MSVVHRREMEPGEPRDAGGPEGGTRAIQHSSTEPAPANAAAGWSSARHAARNVGSGASESSGNKSNQCGQTEPVRIRSP